MPILPENKTKYPPDWKEIRARILRRANNRCEGCGVQNHEWGWRDKKGKFYRGHRGILKEAGHVRPPFKMASMVDDKETVIKIIMIVLTIAHLDHDESNCADDNLNALCQRCHNRHDAKHRAENRRTRLEANQARMEFGEVNHGTDR